MNKTWAASIVALALTVTLAGCSAGPDESKVAAYHTVAHAMPAYKDVTTAGLDKAAKGVCQIFKDDDSKSGWVTATQAATQSGADSAQANVLVQAAVAAYCPEYVKDIPAEVK